MEHFVLYFSIFVYRFIFIAFFCGMKSKRIIVNIIKEILEEKERSQRWLSRKTGIPITTLHGYITNDRQPPADSLFLIAESLEVSTDALMKEVKAESE